MHKKLTATLAHPPGLNATYRSYRDGWYMTKKARDWEEGTLLTLRAAGWLTLPPGRPYWVRLFCVLYTVQMDIDAPLKLLIDTAVTSALGINDRQLGALAAVKVPVGHYRDQKLKVTAEIRELESKADFAAASSEAWL